MSKPNVTCGRCNKPLENLDNYEDAYGYICEQCHTECLENWGDSDD